LKSKYPSFFSARWVSRYAGRDVSSFPISSGLRHSKPKNATGSLPPLVSLGYSAMVIPEFNTRNGTATDIQQLIVTYLNSGAVNKSKINSTFLLVSLPHLVDNLAYFLPTTSNF
jgi:hypothetical protein